jgi:hypothetical protein
VPVTFTLDRRETAVECWASILGDCSGGSSREHYVSDGVFASEEVTAFGLRWCRDQPKQVGLGAAVAKILCRHHNGALSDFDAEAANLSKFLTQSVLNTPLARSELQVHGPNLERWALKTGLNLGYLGALDPENHTRLYPPPELVRSIFLGQPLPAGAGLYFISGRIGNDEFKTGVAWKAVRNQSAGGAIAAVLLNFCGIQFAVNLTGGVAERQIAALGVVDGIDYSSSQIVYRPDSITMQSATAGEKRVILNWGG